MHTFKEKGFEFDTGLHYVSGVSRKSAALAKVVASLTDGAIEWARNDSDDGVFERAVFSQGAEGTGASLRCLHLCAELHVPCPGSVKLRTRLRGVLHLWHGSATHVSLASCSRAYA